MLYQDTEKEKKRMKKNQKIKCGIPNISQINQVYKNCIATASSTKIRTINKYFSKEGTKHSEQNNANHKLYTNFESPYKSILTEPTSIMNDSLQDENDFRSPKPARQTGKALNANCNIKKKRKANCRKPNKGYQKKITNMLQDNFAYTDTNPEHMQMALALSKSEQAGDTEEIEDIASYPSTQNKLSVVRKTLEQFGFKSDKPITRCKEILKKSKKSRYQYLTPILYLRTEENRQNLISSKTSMILSEASLPAYNYERVKLDIKSDYLLGLTCRELNVFNMNRLGYDELEINKFYIPVLNIERSSTKCGHLLRDWNKIPGRQQSPSRQITSHVKTVTQHKSMDIVKTKQSPIKEAEPIPINVTSHHKNSQEIIGSSEIIIPNNVNLDSVPRVLSPDLFASEEEDEINKTINKLQLSLDMLRSIKQTNLSQSTSSCDNYSHRNMGLSEEQEVFQKVLENIDEDNLNRIRNVDNSIVEISDSSEADMEESTASDLSSQSIQNTLLTKINDSAILKKTSSCIEKIIVNDNEAKVESIACQQEFTVKDIRIHPLDSIPTFPESLSVEIENRSLSDSILPDSLSDTILNPRNSKTLQNDMNITDDMLGTLEISLTKTILNETPKNKNMNIFSASLLSNFASLNKTGGRNTPSDSSDVSGCDITVETLSGIEHFESFCDEPGVVEDQIYDLTQSDEDFNKDKTDKIWGNADDLKLQNTKNTSNEVFGIAFSNNISQEITLIERRNKINQKTKQTMYHLRDSDQESNSNKNHECIDGSGRLGDTKSNDPIDKESLNGTDYINKILNQKCTANILGIERDNCQENIVFTKQNNNINSKFPNKTEAEDGDKALEGGIYKFNSEGEYSLHKNKQVNLSHNDVNTEFLNITDYISNILNQNYSNTSQIQVNATKQKMLDQLPSTSNKIIAPEVQEELSSDLDKTYIYEFANDEEWQMKYKNSNIRELLEKSLVHNEIDQVIENHPNKKESNVIRKSVSFSTTSSHYNSEHSVSIKKCASFSTPSPEINVKKRCSQKYKRNLSNNSASSESCSENDVICISDEELNYSSINSTSYNKHSTKFDYSQELNVPRSVEDTAINGSITVLSGNEMDNIEAYSYLEKYYDDQLYNCQVDDPLDIYDNFSNLTHPRVLELNNSTISLGKRVDADNVEAKSTQITSVSENKNRTVNDGDNTATPHGNVIIKTKNITPMPDYDDMNTPTVIKELEKIGVKQLKRHRGVQILKHIYETTHPAVSSQQINEDGEDDNKIVKRRRLNHRKFRRKLDTSSASKESKSEENITDVSTHGNQKIEIVGDIVESDYILERKQYKRTSSCCVPLHIAWHNLISSDPHLKQNILLYKPLQLEVLYAMLKEHGYKYHIEDFLRFLDKKCITIRTNTSQNRKRRF